MGLSKFAALVAAVVGSVDGGRFKRESCGVKGSTGSSDVNMSIVNGQPAPECAWKWQVGLRDSHAMPFCGGMLINKEWVLTAAHCASTPRFNVVAGEYKPNEVSGKEQIKAAVQVIQHPQYSSRGTRWDFALVRLESPMEFNDCVGPICLPEEGADVADDTECWITGWGTLRSGGSHPAVLQEAAVNIVSNDDCVNRLGSQIDEISMLCTQGKTPEGDITDACQGDGGGPLVCESGGAWTLYGAASWGRGCAGENSPGVWARVTAARGWIDATLEQNEGRPSPPKPLTCPDFASSLWPNGQGECKCKSHQFCSTDEETANCPTSVGVPGGYDGRYFLQTCEDCKCIPRQQCPEFAQRDLSDSRGICRCQSGLFCSTDNKTANCHISGRGYGGRYFLSTCEDCTCVPAQECPDFAEDKWPDLWDGDCECRPGTFCSTNEEDANCPTSEGVGGGGGNRFQQSCKNCQCIPPPGALECPVFAKHEWADEDGNCKCQSGLFCSTDNKTANCHSSGRGYGGQYFLPTCEDCTCVPPQECPYFAEDKWPDEEGDCECSPGTVCSTNEEDANCPTSGGVGGWDGGYFLPSCTDCQCTTLPGELECPEFAKYKWPDEYGECACQDGEFCSTDKGLTANCTEYGGPWFWPTCKDCACIPPQKCPDFAADETPDEDGKCACQDGEYCSTDGGLTANCPGSGSHGSFFLSTCEDCACIPPQKCPDFARYEWPDRWGKCECHVGDFCSTDGGVTANCQGGWRKVSFLPTCDECDCFSSPRPRSSPVTGVGK